VRGTTPRAALVRGTTVLGLRCGINIKHKKE